MPSTLARIHQTSESKQAMRSPSEPSPSHYSSSAASAVIASVVPLVAFVYFFGLFLLYKYAKQHPRPVNKESGVRLQKYGPAVYVFMVSSSLAEVAIASWLLIQFSANANYPNAKTHNGVKTLLFSGCWTTVTAGCYTVMFLHPVWSKYTVSSIGAQTLWILFTWFIWVAVVSA